MGKTASTERGYSPDVAEILEKKPHWLVRNGIWIAAAAFALGLAVSHFIPYPERLACDVIFMVPQEGTGDEQVVHGVIRLPVETGAGIDSGFSVSVILPPGNGGNPVRIPGVIAARTLDPHSGYNTFMVHLSPTPEDGRELIATGHAGGQILTGESNLLREVFRPVVSLIRGAGTKQKQER